MRKHVKACWGNEAMMAADSAANANDIHTFIVDGILKNGSIMDSFERKGKGKRSYSTCPLTHTETKAKIVRWVCVNLRPFDIVADEGFEFLMKTGQPELYIPSPITVACDVQLVLRSFVNFVTQGYKGTIGSSREFQHLMTKEV